MIKKFPYFMLVIFLLLSCKTFDNSMLEQKAYFDRSVPSMKVIVNNASVKECDNSVYNSTVTPAVVAKFIKQNLLFESKSKNIYLSIIMRYNKNESCEVLGALLLPFLVFGAPGAYHNTTVTLEAAVMKPDGRIFKTYTATGTHTELAGGTGHYIGDDEAEIFSQCEALRLACSDLREQIKKDADIINKLAR